MLTVRQAPGGEMLHGLGRLILKQPREEGLSLQSTDADTEAQRGKVTPPRPHSWLVVKLGF